MTGVSIDHISVGMLAALVCWLVLNKPNGPRRLPVLGAVLIAVAVTFVSQFLLPPLQKELRDVPVFRRITGTAIFVATWVALLTLTVFERKGTPRKVPIWAGITAAVAAMFVVPAVLNMATGKYQDMSLHRDVIGCTTGMLDQSRPDDITNTCDFTIVVGLCLSDERNPDACRQSIEIAAGQSARLDLDGAMLASRPANLNGATVIACRPPHRPSRDKNVGGRGHRGVCLPGE